MPPADAWDAYVRTVAKNFGHRLEFLEIWNEPDLKGFFEPPVEEYIELCRRAVKIAREVSPKVKIASGGFATMHPGWWDGKPARFHEEVMAATKGCFDIHSYHEHGYFPHYQQMVDNHFIPMRQRLGIEIPWIASETAMHSAKGTDAKQADCLFKKLLFTWARGGKSYTWYGLFDNGYDLEYSEHNFGTIDHFMEPKHVYATYAAIVRLFVEASFQRQITSEGSPWLFAFTAPDSALLAHWNAVSTTGTSIYAAMPEGTMAKASTFDLAGNEKTLLCLDESALFTITETGQVVKLYGAKGFRDVQPVAMLEIPAAMTSEEPVDGTLILRNPVSRQVRCTLSPDISKGAFFSGLPSNCELSSKQVLRVPFTVQCRRESPVVRIGVSFDGIEAPLHVEKSSSFATVCKGIAFCERSPDFTLDNVSQVENKFQFDPESAKRAWKSPADLSAKIWLGCQDETLHIRAEVTDDVHCPHTNPDVPWEGDGIQFALGFPKQDGYFELGVALDAKGIPCPGCWIVPSGFKAEAIRYAIISSVLRTSDGVVYVISIPLSAFGVNSATVSEGFSFNFLVNDCDDFKSRKCFIRLAPGIGSAQTMEHAPKVICK